MHLSLSKLSAIMWAVLFSVGLGSGLSFFIANKTVSQTSAESAPPKAVEPSVIPSPSESARTPADSSPRESSAKAIFADSSPAIVRVEVLDRGFNVIGHGSGFLVSEDGLIATNQHVIRNAYSARVVFPDGSRHKVEGVAACQRASDLALLKIRGGKFPFLKLAGDELPPIGTKVYAIGNPLGLTNSLSDGLVSGHRQLDEGFSFVQTTAAISPGSSGGPLISSEGKVVGVTTASMRNGQNLNLAVPVKLLKELISERGELQSLASTEATAVNPEVRTKSPRSFPSATQQATLNALAESLQGGDEQADLLRAALLVARLDNQEFQVEEYIQQVDRMAGEVSAKLPPNADEKQRLEVLNTFLFREKGFQGRLNQHRFDSYLNKVLDDRKGLPVTLSILYMELARRINVRVVGVGMPAQFMVRHEPVNGDWVMIAPLEGGKFITPNEAIKMVERATGRPFDPRLFLTVSKKAIIVRVFQNLLALAEKSGEQTSMLRYLDGILATDASANFFRWNRARLRYQTGLYQGAREDVDFLLVASPVGLDLNQVRQLKNMLQRLP